MNNQIKACKRDKSTSIAIDTNRTYGCNEEGEFDIDGKCNQCPVGYERDLFEPSKCIAKTTTPATLTKSEIGEKYCKNNFTNGKYDSSTNECWSCPSGYTKQFTNPWNHPTAACFKVEDVPLNILNK